MADRVDAACVHLACHLYTHILIYPLISSLPRCFPTLGRIAQVVYHAAAAAALRSAEARVVRMADLVDAAQREQSKASGDISEMCRTWFS